MIIVLIPVIPAAAMAEVILKRDIGRASLSIAGGCRGGKVGLGSVAVLVVDALGLAGVDVGVVPEGKGGVWGNGVVRVVVVADGGEAFVVVFAGAVVKGEDLEYGLVGLVCMGWDGKGRKF